MKKHYIILITLGVLFALFILPTLSSENTDSTAVVNIKGEVFHREQVLWFFPGFWKEINKETVLLPGESLKTEAGTAEILFQTGVRVFVEENTALKLKEDSPHQEQLQKIDLEEGSLIIEVFKSLRDKITFEIETPGATAAVRGTIFSVSVDQEGTTTISTREGEITVTTAVQEKRVSAGQEVKIPAPEQNFQINPWSENQQDKWDSWEEKRTPPQDVQEKIEKIKENIPHQQPAEKSNEKTPDPEEKNPGNNQDPSQ